MRNLKRDVLIICIMLFTLLHGCFSENGSIVEKNDISALSINNEYIEQNIDTLFSFLNSDKLENAENILRLLKNLELDNTYRKMISLASGIIELRKGNFSQAEERFSSSLPLTEGEIGITACLLLERNASSLEEAGNILNHLENYNGSDIYKFFSGNYVHCLKLYHEFWSNPEEDFYSRLKKYENEILFRTNPLIENILENINESSRNLREEIYEEDQLSDATNSLNAN